MRKTRTFRPKTGCVAALCALTMLAAGQSTPSEEEMLHADQRLQSKISLRLKNCSLARLSEVLTKQLHVTVSVPRAIEGRKVTVICDQLPGEEVASAMRSAMFLHWKKQDAGYILSLDGKIASQEKKVADLADQVGRDAAAYQLSVWMKYKDLSRAQLDQRIKDLEPKLREQPQPDNYQELYDQYSDLFIAQPGWGGALAQAGDDAVKQILDGKTLTFKTEGDQLSGGASVQSFGKSADGVFGMIDTKGSGALRLLRYNAALQTLQARTYILGLGNASASGDEARSSTGVGKFDLLLVNSPIAQTMKSWSEDQDDGLLSKPIEPLSTPAPKFWPLQGAYSVADQLEFLADHAHVPVFADGFRTACSSDQFITGGTVGEWLKKLNQANPMFSYEPGFIRTEKGWVMYRHASYWTKLDEEVDEGQLGALEAKVFAKKKLTVDDYAGLAAALSPKQAVAMRRREVLTRFSKIPLEYAYPGLLAWSVLTSEQKEAAGSSGTLAMRNLSTDQQQRIRQILIEGIWDGAGNSPVSSIVRVIDGSLFTGDSAVLVSDSDHGARSPYYNENYSAFQPGVRQTPKEEDFGSSFRIAFGDRNDVMGYTFRINPPGQV